MTVHEFLLPDLGEGLEDAEVVTWRVGEGDRVELNQTLVEVNTAKALVEIPAPWAGVVHKLHAGEGETVRVGAPLVSIDVTKAPSDQGVPEEAGTPKRRAILVGYGVEEDEGARSSARRRIRPGDGRGGGPVPASPPVRRLAKELNIDLAAVTATGAGGRVTRQDVLKAASGGADMWPEEPARRPISEVAEVVERIPVRGIRRLIAEKMARSAREIPHVTTFLTVDATHVQAFREELTAEAGERISPFPIIVRAFAEIGGQFPKLNASFFAERSEIVLYRDVHIGIATDTERGLVVTVVRDALAKGVVEIADEIARLAEAARSGTARPEEVTGSTVTMSNVGSFGSECGTPIINYPEAAILAVGEIAPKAVVVGGAIEARPSMTLSLSFDHRVMDGAEAGRALKALGSLLENPFRLGRLPR